MMMLNRFSLICASLAVVLVFAETMGTAAAQMNNRPFSFKNSPDGGPGMSAGGRQAIIDQMLFDSAPDNLARGSDGQLVDVVEGPDGSALAFRHGSNNSIPGFHGSDFRGDNELMRAGIFNSWFDTSGNDGVVVGYISDTGFRTSDTISNWTMNTAQTGAVFPYYGRGSVDLWTFFINSLNKF